MQPEEPVALLDQQTAGYDRQWARTAAVRDGLYPLLDPFLLDLQEDARVLCVGVGTGRSWRIWRRRFHDGSSSPSTHPAR